MDRSIRPINIAIQAMGGQGGGVLSDWIVSVAEANGYLAQSTSVPGVAQRTGTTIYYVEIFPELAARKQGKDPVLSLMPSPGDVDIMIAAEMMEAGRAIDRGLVTPNRTTLISSTHRVYAISEKQQMSDGILDGARVLAAGDVAAKNFIYFDMQIVAEMNNSVISSVLLGALAGSEALPFDRESFEDAIRKGGIGVEPSLAAFAAGYRKAQSGSETPRQTRATPAEPDPKDPLLIDLLRRVREEFPHVCHFLVVEGLRRCADYQDPKYAEEFYQRIKAVLDADRQYGGESRQYQLTQDTARYLAIWMTYHDTIRVADYKVRSSRFKRFQKEVHAQDDQVVYVTEFMHPMIQEICDVLPDWLGRMILKHKWMQLPFQPFLNKDREVKTATILGFMLLWGMARLRRIRRITMRYKIEMRNLEQWLKRLHDTVPENYALAVEIARCQRLDKGYSGTHANGQTNFYKIMDVIDNHGGVQASAETIRRLRTAALADEEGVKLADEIEALKGKSAEDDPLPISNAS